LFAIIYGITKIDPSNSIYRTKYNLILDYRKENMKKTIGVSIIIVSIVLAIYIIQNTDVKNIITESNTVQSIVESMDMNEAKEDNSLFFVQHEANHYLGTNELGVDLFDRSLLSPKEENMQLYDSLGSKNSKQSTVVIIPIFTLLAYSDHGFYDYYEEVCNEECLTVNSVSIYQTPEFDYRSSAMANQVFQILGYERITDADVNSDPSILSKYDRVILLHNEYVTKKMFDAITNHPKVIYLYPNALYAEISVDEEAYSITLIRGHGYPEKSIKNGFDWKFENTHPYEFDTKCNDWEFYEIDNGFMLNCYPEKIIFKDIKLLETIRDL